MQHLSPEDLDRIAAGNAPADEFQRHLKECEVCRALVTHPGDAPLLSSPPLGVTAEQQLQGVAPELAAFFDLPLEKAQNLLVRATRRGAWWIPVSFTGAACRPVREVGPSLRGAWHFLVRVRAGGRFPRHTHGRDESVLVLQGGIRDDQGNEVWRGQILEAPVGHWHHFTALGPLDCFCAVVQRKRAAP